MDTLPPIAEVALDQSCAPTATAVCCKKTPQIDLVIVQGVRVLEKKSQVVVGKRLRSQKTLSKRVKVCSVQESKIPVATETIHSLVYRYYNTNDIFTTQEGMRLLQHGCKPKSRRIDFRHH